MWLARRPHRVRVDVQRERLVDATRSAAFRSRWRPNDHASGWGTMVTWSPFWKIAELTCGAFLPIATSRFFWQRFWPLGRSIEVLRKRNIHGNNPSTHRVTDACAIFLSRASAAIARGRGADHHARSTRFFFLRWACSQRFLQIAVILDWCSCHSGGALCSERARRRKPQKPQNVSGQSSVALSHQRKLSYARSCTNPWKLVLSLRTVSDLLAVRLSYYDGCSTQSAESLSEKTLFASYSAQLYPIVLQVMLPKFRKKDS